MELIDAVVISLTNDADSIVATRKCMHSLNAEAYGSIQNAFVMQATTPRTIHADLLKIFHSKDWDFETDKIMQGTDYFYTWPRDESDNRLDISTGLYMKAYRAADYKKIVACTISHMRAWMHCLSTNKDLLVLEQDAKFTAQLRLDHIYAESDRFGIASLNSPFKATRRPGQFDHQVRSAYKANPKQHLYSIPNVNTPDDPPLPQGLPGNSAYIIQPWAAWKLLQKVSEVGIWPNDALICKEFFPWIKTVYPYVTVVQETKSTTTT